MHRDRRGQRLFVVTPRPGRPLFAFFPVIVFVVEVDELVVEGVEVIFILVVIFVVVFVVIFVVVVLIVIVIDVVVQLVILVGAIVVVDRLVVEVVIVASLGVPQRRQIRRLEHGRHCSVLRAGEEVSGRGPAGLIYN